MIQPLKIFRTPNGELGIEFDDESKAVFRLRDLRLACPCALCVESCWTRKPFQKISALKAFVPSGVMRLESCGMTGIEREFTLMIF